MVAFAAFLYHIDHVGLRSDDGCGSKRMTFRVSGVSVKESTPKPGGILFNGEWKGNPS
jgi:hypothetical protein